MPISPPLTRAPTQEQAFVDLVRRLERNKSNHLALQINFSLLASAYRHENYIRIAKETFVSSVKTFEGNLFFLTNTDVIFIGKNVSQEALDPAITRLKILFGGDPLVQSEKQSEAIPFCRFYDLEKDYDGFLHLAEEYLHSAENRSGSFPRPDIQMPRPPIGPELLARLEENLSRADLSSMTRHQTICSFFDQNAPQPLFDEIFVSIENLQTVTTPGTNLLADRWLFQYLTQILDKRVIKMLLKDGIRSDRPFSLNLNLATILTPEFMRFCEAIPPKFNKRLVIELNKLDVFSDMGTFLFARDLLHEHGFRVCLDGLTHHTLPYYDRSRLGFDLIKIYWTPDSIDQMLPEMFPAIKKLIIESGQARTILCRCENEHSIEIGQQLGIVMFQGRHVEQLLAKNNPPIAF